MENNEKYDQPDFENPVYKYMVVDWRKTMDFWNGVRAVRESAFNYLSKFSREDVTDHSERKRTSELYNVFAGTITTVVGMVFKSKVVPADSEDAPIPQPIKDIFSDIDACGSDLSNFLRETFANVARDGHGFILVDAPPATRTNEEMRPTLADVADLKPFWVNYRAAQVINWDYERSGSKDVLTRVVIKEPVTVRVGTYGKETIQQLRELRLNENGKVEFVLWRLEKGKTNKEEWQVFDQGLTGLSTITLICIYGSRKTGFFESLPPYMDLLETNIVHYNSTSKLRTALDYVVPMAVFYLEKEDDAPKFQAITMSSGRSLIMWGQNTRAEYLELKGESIPELRTDLENLERKMAKMGVEKFAPVEEGVDKTAFEVGSDNRKTMSEVGVMAKNLEDGVELAFYYTGLYFNAIQQSNTVNADDLKVRLQLDYDKLTFSTEQIRLFKELSEGGNLSRQTLLEMLPVIAEMPEDFDPEEELKRINAEAKDRFPEL
jgi:hypothetical protein